MNERHYGALQGRSKVGLVDVLSPEMVQAFRAGYDTRPPDLPDEHALSAFRERKHFRRADLPLADRGDAAAGTWIFRRRRVAATPWLGRGYSAGDESRRRRGWDAAIPWNAATRLVRD